MPLFAPIDNNIATSRDLFLLCFVLFLGFFYLPSIFHVLFFAPFCDHVMVSFRMFVTFTYYFVVYC
jgi:hypothetical protein